MSKYIENQNWRYAVKKYDASKKITAEDLATLKEAIRLSTSSYGLQPSKVIFVENPEIDSYINNIAATRDIAAESLSGFADLMKSKISVLPLEARDTWTSKQTYLALGNLINAAAELQIDVTPMEGFNPAQFDEILGLTDKGLHASVIATIGYRHEEDSTQHYKKVRKSNEELFINL